MILKTTCISITLYPFINLQRLEEGVFPNERLRSKLRGIGPLEIQERSLATVTRNHPSERQPYTHTHTLSIYLSIYLFIYQANSLINLLIPLNYQLSNDTVIV
jgi:hypothetical protein